MINLLIGQPGGGKSYEATVYHVIKALNLGRKVITNLPLNLDRFDQLGFDTSLIEIRTKTLGQPPQQVPGTKDPAMFMRFMRNIGPEFLDRPFANPEDYGDTWRHPDNGSGPLYVIDECHLCLPRGATRRDVEEWYSLHRHESADVLLITQSYGKVSKSIIDLVQVCYRVKKATAFGREDKYIRKVQDGVRGEVVNTSIREYQSKYFGLYKSHTRGGGSELAAQDIVPIWMRWPFIGAAVSFVLAFAIFGFGGVSLNPLKNGMAKEAEKPQPVRVVETVNGVVVSDTAKPQEQDETTTVVHTSSDGPPEPFAGRGFHVVGSVKGATLRHLFAVSQNGQIVSTLQTAELIELGYVIDQATPCAVRIAWNGAARWVICDTPTQSVTPTSASVSG